MSNLPWYLQQQKSALHSRFRFLERQEDERLREATQPDISTRWSLGVSVASMNDSRNRYVNIMPYERNRVHLRVAKGNDYINASYVKVDVPRQSIKPGYYIATQGPTRSTWKQFWQMCYHECPNEHIVIVMVTPLKEHGREKCYPYWPGAREGSAGSANNSSGVVEIPRIQNSGSDAPDESSEFPFALSLTQVNETRITEAYTLTEMRLEPQSAIKGFGAKTVYHFYFDQWRDMSKPEEIVPIMQLCDHSHNLNSPGNPIIVHCSAGVGRSGTFITLDHLLHATKDFETLDGISLRAPLTDYNSDLVEQIVSQLRSQRMKMVQTWDQFNFIYQAALHLYNVPA